jgi:hypothetical protein
MQNYIEDILIFGNRYCAYIMATRRSLSMEVIIDAICTMNLILKTSATCLQCLHLEDIVARINDELHRQFYLEIIQSSNGLIRTALFLNNTFNNDF